MGNEVFFFAAEFADLSDVVGYAFEGFNKFCSGGGFAFRFVACADFGYVFGYCFLSQG